MRKALEEDLSPALEQERRETEAMAAKKAELERELRKKQVELAEAASEAAAAAAGLDVELHTSQLAAVAGNEGSLQLRPTTPGRPPAPAPAGGGFSSPPGPPESRPASEPSSDSPGRSLQRLLQQSVPRGVADLREPLA